MTHAGDGTGEAERLEALRDLQLLDTPPERDFDDLVQLASKICNCPISLISLVDADRQWFKATVGTELRETTRDLSFCSQAIEQAELFIVEDASQDARFRDNSLVTGHLGIRFYAGVPLYDAAHYAIGTLCVLDTMPHSLSDAQREMLTLLGRQTKFLLQLRNEKRRLESALEQREARSAALCRENEVLQTERHLFESFLDQSPNPCFLKTADGRYRFYNRSMAELFGIDRNAWIGKRDEDVSPAELAGQYRANDVKVLESGLTSEVLERVNDATGRARVYRSRKFVIHNAGDTLLGGVAVDITDELERQKELEQANLQLEMLATTDALTGLANRRVFTSRMQVEFAKARRKQRSLSLLMLDVDDFKARNDAFGHAAGDDALRSLGSVLRAVVRIGDTVARIGGEEFAVLLPEADLGQAGGIAERLRGQLSGVDAGAMPLTVSIGAASLTPATGDSEQLQIEADDAMYAAKRAGKNRVMLHGEGRIEPWMRTSSRTQTSGSQSIAAEQPTRVAGGSEGFHLKRVGDRVREDAIRGGDTVGVGARSRIG